MENLPPECISHILSFTSPKDVCRLAGVSSAFRSAAECELLWKTFLPELLWEMVAMASSLPPPYEHSMSIKEFYHLLSDHPLLIDFENTSISISVDKVSGLICFMIGVKTLDYVREEEMRIRHQPWTLDPPSRFKEVTIVVNPEFIIDFGTDGKICLGKHCGVYFVFNLLLKEKTSILWRTKDGEEVVPLDDAAMLRADGWMDIDLTGVLNGGEGGFIVFSLDYNFPPPPSGWLIIQGLEFRTMKFSNRKSY